MRTPLISDLVAHAQAALAGPTVAAYAVPKTSAGIAVAVLHDDTLPAVRTYGGMVRRSMRSALSFTVAGSEGDPAALEAVVEKIVDTYMSRVVAGHWTLDFVPDDGVRIRRSFVEDGRQAVASVHLSVVARYSAAQV